MIFNLITKAKGLFYDNNKSGLAATNAQEAIDELSDEKAQKNHTSSDMEYGGATTEKYGHVKLCNDYTIGEMAKPQKPIVPSQRAINDMYLWVGNVVKTIKETLTGKQEQIKATIYNGTTTSDWIAIKREGYILLNAYNIRNDTQNVVKGIQKQGETDMYTVIIDGANNSKVSLWLIWAKNN